MIVLLFCQDLPECFKETDSTVGELVLMLKESGGHLLEHVKQNSWCESLLTEAFTRSRTQGLLWSVVLGRLLDEFHKSGVSFELAVMLADVQSLAPIEETKCQTLIALMSRLESIYELKVITERYSTLLHEDNDESGTVLLLLVYILSECNQSVKVDSSNGCSLGFLLELFLFLPTLLPLLIFYLLSFLPLL